jgi:hypothetical protein
VDYACYKNFPAPSSPTGLAMRQQDEGTIYRAWKAVYEEATKIVVEKLRPPTMGELVRIGAWRRSEWPDGFDTRLCQRGQMAAFIQALINLINADHRYVVSHFEEDARKILDEEKESLGWRTIEVDALRKELSRFRTARPYAQTNLARTDSPRCEICGRRAMPGENYCYAHHTK